MIIGAIVLTGGQSRRMGQPKEMLPFRGSTLLGHLVDTLLLCAHPVVVVARDPEQVLPPLAVESVVRYDDTPGGGPMVGMATGLRAVQGACDAAFVGTCDAPFVDEHTLEWLAGQIGAHDAAIPRTDGVLHPLSALYHTRVLTVVESRLAAGDAAPRHLAEHLDARILAEAEIDAHDPRRRFLRNINTPDDYKAALAETGR